MGHIDPNQIDNDLSNYATALNELTIRNFETFFNHQFSQIPTSEILSDLWFKTDTTTNASIDRSDAEVKLHLDASTSETASVETREHGHYSPGSLSIPGVATRLGSNLTGDQDFWFGYTNETNGVGAGQDTDGMYLFYDKGGSRTKKYQENWNLDVLDGTGGSGNPSGETLNTFKDGQVVRFPFLAYNQGQFSTKIGVKLDNAVEFVTVHNWVEIGDSFLNELNLPIMIKIENNTTASTLDAFLSAVHFERLSKETDARTNGEPRMGQSVGTSWTPLVSIQQRTGWDGVDTRPSGVKIASDTDAKVALLLDTDLGTSASFNLPSLSSSSECAMDVDTSATSFDSNGEKRWSNFVKGGGGSVKFQQLVADVDFNIPTDQILTLAAKCVGSSGTVDSNLSWESEF